jgi:hypothetical protein
MAASPVNGGPWYGIGEMGSDYRGFIIPYVGPKLGARIWRENLGWILVASSNSAAEQAPISGEGRTWPSGPTVSDTRRENTEREIRSIRGYGGCDV